jgi:TRAP-type C4-dicarboxylate transport system permease large subunit
MSEAYLIGKTRITEVVKPLLPLYAAMFICLVLVIVFPQLSKALPRTLDLIHKTF